MTEPPQEPLIGHLEQDQLVAETLRGVPRARLRRGARAGLWALRLFVLVLSALVIYTFIVRL